RLAHYPLALLVIDVDRLTWLNARIGIVAADGVLLELANRLRSVTHRLDYAFRPGGGRFAIVRPGSDGGDAKHARRGSVLVSGSAGGRPKSNGTLQQLAPGEIVLEG